MPGYKTRAKQDSGVVNCTLPGLLMKIKGEGARSSDRQLERGADGGLLSAPQGAAGGRGGGGQISSHYRPTLSAGTLPLGRAGRCTSLSTAAILQLLLCMFASLSALNRSFKHNVFPPFIRERLCALRPAVISSVSQKFSQAVRLRPFTSWAMEKGSKRKPQMAQPRAELWRSPTMFGDGELKGRKGRERGKRNGSGWKRGGKLSRDRPCVSTTLHSHWNTIHKDKARSRL